MERDNRNPNIIRLVLGKIQRFSTSAQKTTPTAKDSMFVGKLTQLGATPASKTTNNTDDCDLDIVIGDHDYGCTADDV
jgi:hypothetical protein